MTALTALGLYGNEISDISSLTGLANLAGLGLARNKISDLSPLAGLTELGLLSLHANRITDVSPLAGLTKLWWLGLSSNEIVDASPLAGLTNLTTLRLSSNQIGDAFPLAGMAQLRGLYLYNNQIADVSPLAGLTGVARLSLRSNEIVDVAPLASLSSLRELDLGINGISDAGPLAELASAVDIWLDFNLVQDISPLTGLDGLASLDLRGNPVNESAIASLDERGVSVQFERLPVHDFDIELATLHGFGPHEERALRYAAHRWMATIVGDIEDRTFAEDWSGECGGTTVGIPAGTRIDDLRVYVGVSDGGGAGRGSPLLVRDDDLPLVGCLELDLAVRSLPSNGLHRMGHILGFGTIQHGMRSSRAGQRMTRRQTRTSAAHWRSLPSTTPANRATRARRCP